MMFQQSMKPIKLLTLEKEAGLFVNRYPETSQVANNSVFQRMAGYLVFV